MVGITDFIHLYIGSSTLQTNFGLLIQARANQDKITSKIINQVSNSSNTIIAKAIVIIIKKLVLNSINTYYLKT